MTGKIESFIIENSLPGQRLDAFLRERFPMISRGAFHRLISEGLVTVNGRIVKPTHTPRAGESVTIHFPDPSPPAAQPEAIPLEVIHESDCFLVLNKPPGIVTHPGPGNPTHTLVNALLHHCAGQLSGIGGVSRPGIVHRLDKDTTGCLVVAKNDAAHLALSEQFSSRRVQKIYHAIVIGDVQDDAGEIMAPIGRHPVDRKRMAANPRGKSREARTSYRVLERLKVATLVEVFLHTGRTHQVRVHLQHIGHPVVGDMVYGKKQNNRLTALTGLRPPRIMLHASSLEFDHPFTNQRLHFTARWPEDFILTLNFLRNWAAQRPND